MIVQASSPERAVASARLVAALSTAGLLVLAAVTELFEGFPRVPALGLPAGLLGIVSPVVALRLYEMLRGQVPVGADEALRSAAFLRATLVALAITEGAALFGLIAWLLGGPLLSLVGILTHGILAGVIWPTEDRLQRFGEPPA